MASGGSLAAKFGAGGARTFFGLAECRDLACIEADIVLIGAAGGMP